MVSWLNLGYKQNKNRNKQKANKRLENIRFIKDGHPRNG